MKKNIANLIEFNSKLKSLPQDDLEASAKICFEKHTSLYQIALLVDALDEESKEWILPATEYSKERYSSEELKTVQPRSTDVVKKMMAWNIAESLPA